MQTIRIPDLEYDKFEAIRDLIYENIFFAVYHIGYSRKLKVGVFCFWDTKYVPKALQKYDVPIPGNTEKMVILNRQFKDII